MISLTASTLDVSTNLANAACVVGSANVVGVITVAVVISMMFLVGTMTVVVTGSPSSAVGVRFGCLDDFLPNLTSYRYAYIPLYPIPLYLCLHPIQKPKS